MRVDWIAPSLMPGTEKLLDEGVMNNRGVGGACSGSCGPCPSRPAVPPRHFSFKAQLGAEPPVASPSSPSPRPAQTHQPAEPFGKNQCYILQAAGPCFTGFYRITATTRASPQVQAHEKMLLSDTRAQPALPQPLSLPPAPGALVGSPPRLETHAQHTRLRKVSRSQAPCRRDPPRKQIILLDQGKRQGSLSKM